ncbi:phage head closure protein [Paenibacillus sp. D2_2]|uniref:phage head closure protein n=1 Tax=Paenibacillus sp. D2_2 TaxID=3073092 RepID=UPI002816427E|nr:phage head closure protein [Paenibacillus sp. D2_2]WMT42846.1 phage head closure protein [Paenibacillus sp. D2_2]
MDKSLVDRLDKRVTILRPPGPDDTDEYGQPLDELIDVCEVWAAIEPLQGKEFIAAMQENAEVTTRIRIRYRTGIDRTMTVKYGEHEFEILYIIHPQFAKKELQLMCKERQ